MKILLRVRFGLFAALAMMLTSAALLWGYVEVDRILTGGRAEWVTFTEVYLLASLVIVGLVGTAVEAIDRWAGRRNASDESHER